MTSTATWLNFEAGSTIGIKGAEGGSIFRDEEHESGARITLERDCKVAPYAITCGIYGWLVHTRFIADEPTAIHEYDKMKASLAEIIALIPDENDDQPDFDAATDAVTAFSEAYA